MRDARWHPVALSADLGPGTSTGTRLFGQELVLWRDEDGACHAWEDRCPHRGMRLSFGFVRGARMTCLYHGWQFDGDGRCRFIPAHPRLDVPATITVVRYSVTERLGMAWVALAEDLAADDAPVDGGDATPVRSLAIETPAETVWAALRDAASPFDGGAGGVVDARVPIARFAAEDVRLHAAVQAVSLHEAMLHVVLTGTIQPGARQRASLWAEAVRRRVEAARMAEGLP